jgi:hypothetical protein
MAKNEIRIFDREEEMSFTRLRGEEAIECDCCKRKFIPDNVKIVRWNPKSIPSHHTKVIYCEDCMEHFNRAAYDCAKESKFLKGA